MWGEKQSKREKVEQEIQERKSCQKVRTERENRLRKQRESRAGKWTEKVKEGQNKNMNREGRVRKLGDIE